MIGPIGSGITGLYGGAASGLGEVDAVRPVQRRAAADAADENAATQAAERANAALPTPGPTEAGKGLLVDLYA